MQRPMCLGQKMPIRDAQKYKKVSISRWTLFSVRSVCDNDDGGIDKFFIPCHVRRTLIFFFDLRPMRIAIAGEGRAVIAGQDQHFGIDSVRNLCRNGDFPCGIHPICDGIIRLNAARQVAEIAGCEALPLGSTGSHIGKRI